MDSKFSIRLEEYLDSECDDYDLEYSWIWDNDIVSAVATVTRSRTTYKCDVTFKYDAKKDDLLIELSEDSFYPTREFDNTVKYFWMLVVPALFPENK